MGGLGSGRKPSGAGALVPASSADVKDWPLRDRLAKRFRVAELSGPEALAAQTRVWKGKSASWKRAAVAALKAQGYTAYAIADLIGSTSATVHNTLSLLRRKGRIASVEAEYDDVIVPLAMEAHRTEIENPASPGHQKAYLAALTGRGVLRTGDGRGASGGAALTNQLQVVFQMPESGPVPVLTGQVVGVPREDA